MIRPSNRASIRNISDYSPFGVQLSERTISGDGYRFGFNGMLKDDEIKNVEGSSYDFGARIYDSRVGRFLSLDNFSSKYPHQTPYCFAGNTPIMAIDVNGDSLWVTTSVKNKKGIQYITNTIHVTGKVLDLADCTTSGGCTKEKSLVPLIIYDFETTLNAESAKTSTQNTVIKYQFDVSFEEVSSMSQVNKSDHLIVFINDVTGSADKNLGGGEAGGRAALIGKIAYVEKGRPQWMADAMIHELGHDLGLSHSQNGTGNYMSYDKTYTNFTYQQLQEVHGNVEAVGKTSNSAKSDKTDSWFWGHTSTQKEPWDDDVKKGEKIPLPLD